MGAENYLRDHPLGKEHWYPHIVQGWLEKLAQAGVKIGSYLPKGES